jgi:hypothetical protein
MNCKLTTKPQTRRTVLTYFISQETVPIEVTYNSKTETFTALRLLLTHNAPGFATIFKYPGIKSIKIHDVPPRTFDIFLAWLRTEYWRNAGTVLDLWREDVDEHPD